MMEEGHRVGDSDGTWQISTTTPLTGRLVWKLRTVEEEFVVRLRGYCV